MSGVTGNVLRVGTRGSALALAQSGAVATAVAQKAGGTAELVRVRTEGDVNSGPLALIGGTGVFVTAVRAALLDGRVDLIVHSFKDLPTAPAPGLRLAAVPERADPRDALCAIGSLDLAALPRGARVGTGSPRRGAQLLLIRPDLTVIAVRGNVDTRLRLVSDGDLHAVVLAVAGLARLDRTSAITEVFEPEVMLPAPAQGALAVESRADQAGAGWYCDAVGDLDHAGTRASALAERSLLSTLEAGCIAPVGAHATIDGDRLRLAGAVIAVDGTRRIAGTLAGQVYDAGQIGRDLALSLLSQGAGTLIGAAR